MSKFATYTDRELVDNWLDRSAALLWRMEVEDALVARGYVTRRQDGTKHSREHLLGVVAIRERDHLTA